MSSPLIIVILLKYFDYFRVWTSSLLVDENDPWNPSEESKQLLHTIMTDVRSYAKV